jgi:putative NADH-flavin reductase
MMDAGHRDIPEGERMRIVVFGASGRTGSAVVERALGRGHEVNAFVRDASKVSFADPSLSIVEGDAFDLAAVTGAIGGADAVISALGARRDDQSDLSETTANVILGTDAAGASRLVIVVNVGVFLASTKPEFAAIREQHLANVEALRDSVLDWTAVAPASIEAREGAGSYDVVVDAKPPEWQISRVDLADALLDALGTDAWIGHVVGVSGP